MWVQELKLLGHLLSLAWAARNEAASIWDVGTAGGDFTCYTIMPNLVILAFIGEGISCRVEGPGDQNSSSGSATY